MSSAGARPPTRTRGLGSLGSHPMASMSGVSERFAGDMPGPPVGTGTAAQGRPNWFGNTGGGAPREGFLGAVGPPGTSSTGPPASAMMAPSPDEPLEVMGLMTNHSAPYMKIGRKLSHALMETSQVYQILMTRREGRQTGRRRGRESRRYTILNLPALNYFLAMDSKMPVSPEDVTTAQDVLNEWHFEGVARTEQGKREMRHDREVGMERAFNSVVRGFAYTFNIFGTNVRTGTKLFLIVKKMPAPTEVGYKSRPWSDERIAAVSNGRTPLPFQFVPFGDWRYDAPPEEDLEYQDEFGFRRRGEYIYIGRAANHSPVPPNFREVDKAYQDLTTILTMPQFFMFVDRP